jgi:hypothetical protein
MIEPIRRTALIVLLAGLLGLPAGPVAGDDNLRNYLELVRSDMSSAKVAAINEVMRLADAEAEVFWPIYRQYELELSRIVDDRFALTKRFVTSVEGGELTAEEADQIAAGFFDILERRIKLWKKYHGRIKKALSPVRAGQFVQIENQISLFVDLNIASEMPVIEVQGER